MRSSRLIRETLRVVLVASGLLVAGCTDKQIFAPTANEYVVHAVLDASERRQFVLVEHSDGTPSAQSPVHNAVVTIAGPGGRIFSARLVRDTVRAYFPPGAAAQVNYVRFVYLIDLSRTLDSLIPGGTYALRVRIDSTEITGETTIPNVAKIAPEPTSVDSFHRTRDTLAISLEQSSSARPHQLLISESGVVRYEAFAHGGFSLPGTMTMLNVRNNKQEPVFVPNISYDVSVLAVDANYYKYFINESGAWQSSSNVNGSLRGALGVFGSVARVERRRLAVQ